MKKNSVKRFFQNILLAIELIIYIAYLHFDKVLFIGIIALDQYTKFLVTSSMQVSDTIPIIPNIFHITYVENPGAAFGILPYRQPFFIGMGTVILAIAAMFYARFGKNMNKLTKYAGITATAGALANMIDRINTGYVTDLFDMRIFKFPVFNVADIAIVIGMFIMMYVVMFPLERINAVEEVRQP